MKPGMVKGLAYVGALGGIGISLWGNVRDAYIPEIPDKVKPELWREGYPGYVTVEPEPFDLVLAVFFPITLIIALELLVHAPWTQNWRHVATRYGGVLGLAAIAGFVSYWHLRTALLLNGAGWWIATLGPLAVDGFVFMCTQVLLMMAEQDKEAKDAAAAAPPPPSLVPRPPLLVPTAPIVVAPPATPVSAPPTVPPPVAPDVPPERASGSPWTTPPVSPGAEAPAPQDTATDVLPDAAPEQGEHLQVTDAVPPSLLPVDGGDIEGAAAPGQRDTDTLSAPPADTTVPLDIPADAGEQMERVVPLDTSPLDIPADGDTTDADPGSSPVKQKDMEIWAAHHTGKTKKELAEMFGCHEKTIQRSLSAVRKAQAAGHINGRVPDLVGAGTEGDA